MHQTPPEIVVRFIWTRGIRPEWCTLRAQVSFHKPGASRPLAPAIPRSALKNLARLRHVQTSFEAGAVRNSDLRRRGARS